MMHALRQVAIRGAHAEMIVVGKDGEGIEFPSIRQDRLPQNRQKHLTGALGREDILAVIATAEDVEGLLGDNSAFGAGHETMLASRRPDASTGIP